MGGRGAGYEIPEKGSGKGAAPSKKPFKDVTRSWKSKNYKPNVVTDPESVVLDGVEYKVDGDNVKIVPNKIEYEMALLLSKATGEQAIRGPEIVGIYKHVKCPDILLGDSFEKWDVKELHGQGKDALRARIRTEERQAHKFIIEVSKAKMDLNEVYRQAENVFRAPNTEFVEALVIVKDGKIVRVLERN